MSEGNISVVGSQQNLVPVTSRKERLKKRTPLEVKLLVLVAILAVLLFIFFLIIIVQASRSNKPKAAKSSNGGVCNSEKCIASAFSLLESMNRSVDPCDNFYEFACGNFARGHSVQEGDIYASWFYERDKVLRKRLRDLLLHNVTSSDPKLVLQTKEFFDSCVDVESLESLGLHPIVEVLTNLSLPGRIPNDKTVEGWDIGTTLALIQRQTSTGAIVRLGAALDGGKLILKLSSPSKSLQLFPSLVRGHGELPRITKLNSEEKSKVMKQYMIRILINMDSWSKTDTDDPDLNESSIQALADNIINFSDNITKLITGDYRNTSSSTTAMFTFPELQQFMDASTRSIENSYKIDWDKYLTVLIDGTNTSFNKNKHSVLVSNLAYFQDLAWLIANTDVETLQLYVWWQVVEVLAPHTNKAMRNIHNEMREQLYGPSLALPRSLLCLNRVKKLLSPVLRYKMAAVDDISAVVSKVSEMMNDIKNSFKSLVKDSDWLDSDTKKAAQEKADAIIVYIGYQDMVLQPSYLDEYYELQLELEKNKYLQNILTINSNKMESLLNMLHTKFLTGRNDSWTVYDTLEVDAQYSPSENSIMIPAGILQFPFCDRGLEVLTYGAIGSILGHELTHGFDSQGKDYGKDGRRVSWWKDETLNAFNERTECFIQQYSNYSMCGIQVNGEQTLAENIADNGGIREVFRAYQLYKKRNGPEPALPGFEDFTHEQLLFLSYANMWCLDPGQVYYQQITYDEHSPQKYRVLGSLSNSPEFSKTWNCAANMNMNPSERCIIW